MHEPWCLEVCAHAKECIQFRAAPFTLDAQCRPRKACRDRLTTAGSIHSRPSLRGQCRFMSMPLAPLNAAPSFGMCARVTMTLSLRREKPWQEVPKNPTISSVRKHVLEVAVSLLFSSVLLQLKCSVSALPHQDSASRTSPCSMHEAEQWRIASIPVLFASCYWQGEPWHRIG